MIDYGMSPETWPAPALASLTHRHNSLLSSIATSVCSVPRDLFFPLGPASRRLLNPEVVAAEEDEKLELSVRESERSQVHDALDGDSEDGSDDGARAGASPRASVVPVAGSVKVTRQGSVIPLNASSLADAAAAAFAEGKRAAAAAAAAGGGGYGGYGDDGYDRSYYNNYEDDGGDTGNGNGDYYQADPLAR